MPADEFFLDPRQVRRAFDAASSTYESSSAVHAEIRTRLIERLDVVRLQPAVILDLGAGDGQGARRLKDRYSRASVIALDLSKRMLVRAGSKQRWLRRFERIAADAHRVPLRDGSVDLVFSNLVLEWCSDPDAVFREIRRVLKPGGLFTFTTLGPDTLKEVRDAWRGVDPYAHVHRFIDMHDLGDALVRARFAEPVMDVERLTVTYSNLEALRTELRGSGSGNIAHGRPAGLTSRARGKRLRERLQSAMRDGVLPASIEVVYGHAWAGELPPRRPQGTQFSIPVHAVRTRKREGI